MAIQLLRELDVFINCGAMVPVELTRRLEYFIKLTASLKVKASNDRHTQSSSSNPPTRL